MSIDMISYGLAKKALKQAGNVGEKATILTDLQDKEIVRYDADQDVFVNVRNKAIVEQWKANHEYESGEIFLFDQMIWITEQDHVSNSGTDPKIDEINGLCYPISTDAGFQNLVGLEATILNDGASIQLNWFNPSAASYEGRDIYYSSTVDITTLRRSEIEDRIGDGADIVKITTGSGTGAGEADTIAIPNTTTRTYYYVKGFAEHYDVVAEKTVHSTGRYLEIANPDLVPPSPITNLAVVQEGPQISFTWTQPADSDFFYTKIVRSQSGIPTSPTDGIVLDAISGTGVFVDTIPSPSLTYYYKLFTFDDAGDGMQSGVEGNWNSSTGSETEARWVAVLGYNFVNDERTDDAVNFVQSDFDNIYPFSDMVRCVVDGSGNVVYYLDEEDSTLQEDGITPAVLDGTDGHVVVEIPEFYYAISNTTARVSEEEFVGSTKFERSYIGFAEASVDGVGLHTVAGEQPARMRGLTEFRNMTPNGWQLMDVHTRDVVKMLFMVEYGGMNSQILLGDGIVNGSTVNTGGTLGLGNANGTINGSVSYRGIENLWGNIDEIVEGLVATDKAYYTASAGFNTFVDDKSIGSYVDSGVVPIVVDGFVSRLSTTGVVVADEVEGNNVDFVGDHQYSHKAGEINMVVAGGNNTDGNKAGLFRLHMGLTPFGREDEMVTIGEFGKVVEGTEEQSVESIEMEFVEEMQVDGEDGFYFTVQVPDFSGRKWFRSFDGVSVREVE